MGHKNRKVDKKRTARTGAVKSPISADISRKMEHASALQRSGETAKAQAALEEVLKAQPKHFDAVFMLGLISAQTRNLPRAAELFGAAADIRPDSAPAHCNRGVALAELRQFDAALASYDRAIAVKTDYAAAHVNRGNVLKELGQLAAALSSFDRAIEIQPEFAEAFVNRGAVLRDLERLDEALASYDRAIAIRPNSAEAYSNRGIVLKKLGRFDAALTSYDQAIAIRADHAEAYLNRGLLFAELGRVDLALPNYDRAIAIKADFAEAHFNRSQALLLAGDYENGWPGYEWRRREGSGAKGGAHRQLPLPQWLGKEPLAGKTILLYSEQGLGDTLQFCRYAKLVADLGARVILEVQRPLVGLLAQLEGVSQTVAAGDTPPEADYCCPLLSLPLAFNTRLDSIPRAPRYLSVSAALVNRWQERLGEKTQPRVGLMWSGNAAYQADRNRSIRLADLIPQLPAEFQYVSLQKEVREIDRPSLQSNRAILNFAEEQQDFSDAAALCECMDLVLSVDTSVAHLSAALGKETWIMLPFSADWRWLLARDDSPWYPSVKLFRQRRVGDWSGVFERVWTDLIQRRD
jgi:tetratricopeptide (TPR) repeat protein